MELTPSASGLLALFSHRRPRVLVLAALTGALTGAAVAVFDWVTSEQLFDRLLEAPLALQVGAPLVGLALAAGLLLTAGRGAAPSTSDEYIKNFHDRSHHLDLSPVLGRLAAGMATLGLGGSLGYEGPSMYLGASVGTALQRRWGRWFTRDDAKVLMVAGAAAGVAAIFKAPATGAIFALEVPYRDDNARHMLLPALIAAATGYLVFVAFVGTAPLFAVAGSPPFDLRELGGAALLGLLCGLGARGFAVVIGQAKRLAGVGHPAVRVAVAGVVLGGLAIGSHVLFDAPLSLGPGYQAVEWATEPGHSLALVIALFAFRLVATASTIAGGGVGGLFVPLVVAGAIAGSALSSATHDTSTLFPLIGIAAFLGAGYRTPLAGVMFVAETTGRPGFVVPGLIASVVSQLVMGDVSVSAYQHVGRIGHLERRFQLPISSVIDASVLTVPPDASLSELYERLLLVDRRTDVPVVDGSRYRGVASMTQLRHVPVHDWPGRDVESVLVEGWPTVGLGATVEDAIRAMDAADVDLLPVVDGDAFIGVVTTANLVGLDQILGQLEPPS